jgi:hypothetical protein
MTSTSHKQYVDVMAGDGKKGAFLLCPKRGEVPTYQHYMVQANPSMLG